MGVPGRRVLTRSLRWARSRFRRGVLVLGYHRVASDAPDALGLAVRPDHFAAHLELIRRRAAPLSLRAAVRAVRVGNVPRRAVVVTFDDGYADAVEQVLPLLELHDVPATVFITTGSPGRPFWWDELVSVISAAPTLPRCLGCAPRTTRRPSWRRMQTASVSVHQEGERHQLLRSLAAALEDLSSSEREVRLRELRALARVPPPLPRHRALTHAEIGRLAASPLIEIGAHTVSHPKLALLTLEDQRREIVHSRRTIEAITGQSVFSFSYPHGSYVQSTISTVRAAGFETACTSQADMFTSRGSALLVPRFWGNTATPERFERWLDRWLTD